MKTSILFLVSMFITPTVYGKIKCMTNAIGVIHEKSFGLSIGGGSSGVDYGEENLVNVPLSINNRPACFIKRGKFKLKNEAKKGKDEINSITLSPMKTDFENVPAANQKQYIFVEKNDNIMETKFHIMSFVCSGEIPLSIEATTNSYIDILMEPDTANLKVSTVFATGKAAQNLKESMNMSNGPQGKSPRDTFNFFNKIYLDKTQKEIMADQPCCTDYKIPSMISDTSIKSLAGIERAIASSFTTMGPNVPNGCSNDFSETMSNYQLENYSSNESLKGYTVKKKWFSDDLVFEW